jgi:hypothetical protein
MPQGNIIAFVPRAQRAAAQAALIACGRLPEPPRKPAAVRRFERPDEEPL